MLQLYLFYGIVTWVDEDVPSLLQVALVPALVAAPIGKLSEPKIQYTKCELKFVFYVRSSFFGGLYTDSKAYDIIILN